VNDTVQIPEAESLTPASSRDLKRLDRSLLASIAWTAAAKWIVQTLSWASTLIVVRLLVPSDYGVVGMATAFLALLQPLCDFGIAAAIVQGRHLTSQQIARLNGLAIALGAACAAVTVAITIPISRFFNEPALLTIVPVLGLGFFTGAFRVVPTALLAREMQFRRLAFLETAEALSLTAITIVLAATGHGYWSLVIGPVASRGIGSLLAVLARPSAIGSPLPIARIRGAIQFGAWVTTSTLAWYVYSNADRVIVGRQIGEAALGAYTIALTLASMPVEKIGQLYQRVAESVIARVQDDSASVARYLFGITEGVAMLSFPASVGLALVADLFVEVVLGARWTMAVVPLRLLAAAAAIRSLDPLLAQILVATGHARQNARSMLIAALVLPGAFLLGGQWGLAGVATVWLVGHPLVVMARQVRKALVVANATPADYFRALRPAATGTLLMAIAVLGVRSLTDDVFSRPVSFGLVVAVGAAVYVAALVTLFPQRLRAAKAFVRNR
jgi:PST family polysaccharide transporter